MVEKDGFLPEGEGEVGDGGGLHLEGGLGGGGQQWLDLLHFDGLGQALRLWLGYLCWDWGLDRFLFLHVYWGLRGNHGQWVALGEATPFSPVHSLKDDPGIWRGNLLQCPPAMFPKLLLTCVCVHV